MKREHPRVIALGPISIGWTQPGSNLGAALDALEARGIAVVARFSDWPSPAWPDPSAPAYVNSVAEVATGLAPRALLDQFARG